MCDSNAAQLAYSFISYVFFRVNRSKLCSETNIIYVCCSNFKITQSVWLAHFCMFALFNAVCLSIVTLALPPNIISIVIDDLGYDGKYSLKACCCKHQIQSISIILCIIYFSVPHFLSTVQQLKPNLFLTSDGNVYMSYWQTRG